MTACIWHDLISLGPLLFMASSVLGFAAVALRSRRT